MANERSHALLAPSAASRWLMCSKSARQEEKFIDTASSFAAEGTLAHTVAEMILQNRLDIISDSTLNRSLALYEEHDEMYNSEMFTYADEYADFVMEKFNEVRQHTPDAKLELEVQIDLRAFIPESFGHVDVVIVADRKLIIIDLKYGKGVPVNASKNKQGMIYALGALDKYDMLYDIDDVEIIIYQPRLDMITDYTISRDEIYKWAEDELKPRAKLAFNGEGEYVVGEHCRFCKFAVRCKAFADHNLEIAKYEFAMAEELKDEDISDILTKISMLENWATTIKEYALAEAVNHGKKWPGFKLVEGRSNRAYTDEVKVEETLVKHSFKPDQIFKPKKLFGITELQKRIGKAAFTKFVEPLLIKPAGKPVLVTVEDRRPELNSVDKAREDFADDF